MCRCSPFPLASYRYFCFCCPFANGYVPVVCCVQALALKCEGSDLVGCAVRTSAGYRLLVRTAHPTYAALASRITLPQKPHATPNRMLKNYLRCHRCVKNRLGREPDQNAHLQLVNSAFDSLRSPCGPAYGCYSAALRCVAPVFALRWPPLLRF